jgi:hypothetical protein
MMRLFKKQEDYPKCPLLGCKCLESRCAWWVQLLDVQVDKANHARVERKVGYCSVAWFPKLLVEMREAVERDK